MEKLSEKFFDRLDEILGLRLTTCPHGLLETLDSQPNELLSDETDLGDQEDDYKNSHSSISAGISDNLDSSEPSGRFCEHLVTASQSICHYFHHFVMTSSNTSPLFLFHFFPLIPLLSFCRVLRFLAA